MNENQELINEERRAALQHWENCFRNGTVDDEHAEFIAGILAKAKEDGSNENQELIDKVIEEMKLQIADNDWTVIEELLTFVPKENLVGFLPEEDEL